jgi:hypothetical protein
MKIRVGTETAKERQKRKKGQSQQLNKVDYGTRLVKAG